MMEDWNSEYFVDQPDDELDDDLADFMEDLSGRGTSLSVPIELGH
jgi:hypothetical protein